MVQRCPLSEIKMYEKKKKKEKRNEKKKRASAGMLMQIRAQLLQRLFLLTACKKNYSNSIYYSRNASIILWAFGRRNFYSPFTVLCILYTYS